MKIAIASGKGGTGKTLVATSLFHVLQSSGYHTTLVDCDAEEPNDMLFITGQLTNTEYVYKSVPEFNTNKCNFCGKCREYCTYNAILIIPPAGIIRVYDELCHDCGACVAACDRQAITYRSVTEGSVTKYITEAAGGSDSESRVNTVIESKTCAHTYSPVSVIKAALKDLPDKSITILDSPPGTSCPFIHTVLAADHVLLIAEPTPFGVSDLKQSVATLRELNRTFSVIINRAGIGNDEIYTYLKQEGIEPLLEIPFDKSIALNYSNGQIVTKHSAALYSKIADMAAYILNTYGNSGNKR